MVLNRRADAGERLVEIAETASSGAKDESRKLEWRGRPEAPVPVGHVTTLPVPGPFFHSSLPLLR